jgi:uncharacterized protein (DUF39 family)
VAKTIAEINRRIKAGEAVVVTAEEMVDIVRKDGPDGAAVKVDVVTTGTFGAMCSSGAFLNLGHTQPRIKMKKVWLNEVEAYAGIAAVDAYVGATQAIEGDPGNSVYPGHFRYGGGHVIEALAAGEEVRLRAEGGCTDCYPRKKIKTWIRLADINEAFLFNPRNAYQNYNVGVNLSDKRLYTYMGILQPKMGNVNWSSAAELSPLFKDPKLRTIGIGTRIFLGGGVGYVAWNGTQYNPNVDRSPHGVPLGGACTLALVGDLKQMSRSFLKGLSLLGYGTSLAVGVGIPIPILDADLARTAGLSDAELLAPVVDYGNAYPAGGKITPVARVSYAELKTGKITLQGREIPASSLSSIPKAREIAETLKTWIASGRFALTEPVQALPGPGETQTGRPLVERGHEGGE